MSINKQKLNEGIEKDDIKMIKQLIRDVVADILRDLWIKRAVWKKTK